MILADRYQVLERLSAGGMGVVYKARHVALDDLVALKVLLKPQKEEDQRRFLLEARVATKIKHPNTVYVSDYGVMPDGRSYLVMELLQGQTLARALKNLQPAQREKKPPPEQAQDAAPPPTQGMDPLRACRIALQIARGLHAVHEKGIVHRDLKPENVFLIDQETPDGSRDFVKIVDFGIAKVTRVGPGEKSGPQHPTGPQKILAGAEAGSDSTTESGAEEPNATLPGMVMGTPAYMSPEAIEGKVIDARADQYSLGCVLFEMLTGHTPFRTRSAASMLMKHLSAPLPQLRQDGLESLVSKTLEALVLRLLSKSPEARFPTMHDVAQALAREIDLILIARGEKTVLPSALAGAIAGKGLGAALILGRFQIPLVALLPLALGLVAAGGLLTYKLVGRPTKPRLAAGELANLHKRSIELLRQDLLEAQNPLPIRVFAAQALGQSQDAALRPDLEAPLTRKEENLELRAQAAEALGQLGDRGAVPALVPLLDPADSPLVSVAAAAALRQLGDRRGQEALVNMLDSQQAETQLRAALRLCEPGQQKARERLHDFQKRSGIPEEAQLEIEACLARAGEPEAKAALRTRMQAPGPAVPRILAAARLAQLGDQPAQDYLNELVRKKDAEQLLAARLLAGPDAPQNRDLFREVVAAPQAELAAQRLGAEGLGAISEPFDARLLGTLLLPKATKELRQSAAAAIILIALHDPSSFSTRSLLWARSAIGDRNWLLRQAAATVLGDSASGDAVALLGEMGKDADARVRRSAVRALGRRSERAALQLLLSALADSDAGVRSEALRALGRLVGTLLRQGARDLGTEAGPALHRLIDKGAANERILALGLLARLGERSELVQMLEFKDTPDVETRRLFVEQLEGRPELLVSALADKEFQVRFAAARKLAEQGDARAIAVLREALEKGGAAAVLAHGMLSRLGAPLPANHELLSFYAQAVGPDRIAAVEAAARLPVAQARLLLLQAARDASIEVRMATAAVAAELSTQNGAPAGMDVLKVLLTDPDAAVRARAQALLAARSAPAETAAGAQPEKKAADEEPARQPRDARTGDSGTPAPAAPPEKKDSAAGALPSEQDAAAGLEGLGLLVLKGPDFVQYQLDGKRWQYLSGKPQKLPPGPHRLVTMGGKREITIEEKRTSTLELAPSPIEEAAHNGIEAYERKDYGKAQKLLERAYQRCERARSLAQPCANLSSELSFYLGSIHETQNRLDEAATEYQQVADATVHGRLTDKQREAAAASLRNLSQRLGLVIVRTAEQGSCKEKKMWLPPGSHRIKFGSERKEVKVRAQEPVEVGTCP